MGDIVLSIIVVLGVTVGIALPVSVLRYALHNFFDYPPERLLWLMYTGYHGLTLSVIVLTYYFSDSILLTIFILLLVIIGEIVLFYKRYYSFESSEKYFLYIVLSYMLGTVLLLGLYRTALTYLFYSFNMF